MPSIHDFEHACDTITHDIIRKLNQMFVTPIDREDIYALAKALDDVLDAIDDAPELLRRAPKPVIAGGTSARN